MIVDLHLQIDGLNVENIDRLMDWIHRIESDADTIYNIIYDYEIVDDG